MTDQRKDRLEQKNEMMVLLGELLGPLRRIAENPNEYDAQEEAEVIARFFHDSNLYEARLRDFSLGQPGHYYHVQRQHSANAMAVFRQQLTDGAPLIDALRLAHPKLVKAISDIPVPRTSVVLEAGSPFTAYLKLRQLCESDAQTSLLWLDAYSDARLFHRYLASVPEHVSITLVATPPAANAGRGDRERWTALLDVSMLFASERGPTAYRLIQNPALHDRWVVFDEKRIYAFGGSAKDAGVKKDFTISAVDPTEQNLGRIRSHVEGGVELFGPKTPQHASI